MESFRIWKGNKRKSMRHKFDRFVMCDGDGKFIMGVGKDGSLTFYGRYDEKNDQHRLLKKIDFGGEIRNNYSVWQWGDSECMFGV